MFNTCIACKTNPNSNEYHRKDGNDARYVCKVDTWSRVKFHQYLYEKIGVLGTYIGNILGNDRLGIPEIKVTCSRPDQSFLSFIFFVIFDILLSHRCKMDLKVFVQQKQLEKMAPLLHGRQPYLLLLLGINL